MKSRTLWLLSLSLATVGLAATAQAVVICFDYALYRAAEHAGIPGCDPNPPGVSAYLSADQLKLRLKALGYELVSGPDPLTFGGNMFNTPRFAEEFLRPNDVVFMRDNHVGFVSGADFSTTPYTTQIDHYIQNPNEIRTTISYAADSLPAQGVTRINDTDVHYGFWANDPVQEFLHNRTFAQGGGVEVWRRIRSSDPNAKQLACAAPIPPELVLRLTTAGATCEVKWTIGKTEQPQTTYCRSTIDGPAAANSVQLTVTPDGAGPAATAEATWEGFKNLQWGWNVQIRYATFQGQGSVTCTGADDRCAIEIPVRPTGTGPAVGREYVGVNISWDAASGPGNPGVGLPGGLGVNGLGIEQGIDYRR